MQEIIFIKVEDYIINNYKYYKNYNPRLSKFSTFLYKDVILTTIKVLREENLRKEYYTYSSNCLLPNDSDHDEEKGTKVSHNNNLFDSKKELKNWLDKTITDKEKYNDVVKTIKRRERYVEKTANYDSQADLLNPDQETYTILSDPKVFLKQLDKIEEEPIFRLILKIILNININYLNYEISLLFNTTPDIYFIRGIKNLYNHPWSSNKGNFFIDVHKFLGSYFSQINDIKYLSIQQRISRNFKKIREVFLQNELQELLLLIKNHFYLDLLKTHPLFLSTYSTEYCESSYENNAFGGLKAADLSNNNLQSFPSSLKDALNIEYIDLSGNSFSEIPQELFMLINPKVIIMQDQDFALSQKSVTQYKSKYPECQVIQ